MFKTQRMRKLLHKLLPKNPNAATAHEGLQVRGGAASIHYPRTNTTRGSGEPLEETMPARGWPAPSKDTVIPFAGELVAGTPLIGDDSRKATALFYSNGDDMKNEAAAKLPADDFAEKNEAATDLALPKNAPPPVEDDLPEEVKKQLIGYAEIELESQLIDTIANAGNGLITVDKIVLALWKRHKKVVERQKLIRTLNAMAAEGAIEKNDSPRGYRMRVIAPPAAE